MKALLRLEKDFQGCMLANQLDMGGQVVGDAHADAAERVQVYVEGYRLRLLDILQTNFTGLHGLLGDEQFDTLGRAYIDAYPSTHRSVRWFGRHLETFLRDTPPYDGHLYLAEMAAFEWAQGLVFDAADEPMAEMQTLAALPPDAWAGLRFTLHAAVQRLDMRWNIPKVWQVLEANEAPELQDAEVAGLRTGHRFHVGGQAFLYPVMVLGHVREGQVHHLMGHHPSRLQLLVGGLGAYAQTDEGTVLVAIGGARGVAVAGTGMHPEGYFRHRIATVVMGHRLAGGIHPMQYLRLGDRELAQRRSHHRHPHRLTSRRLPDA